MACSRQRARFVLYVDRRTLPLLCPLGARTRLAVGLALSTVGLFLLIAALAHGVIALIVGAIFRPNVCRGRHRERLTYSSR